ncbi:MAG: hypothetical protein US51_C0047G0006 [Microgenomates group bacterium GW2011_GWA2_37_6]|nr:MAG: hypothetical protein US51_C0047G0006 [Microgenomates group bacterium GW2011_GWA2_37_6]
MPVIGRTAPRTAGAPPFTGLLDEPGGPPGCVDGGGGGGEIGGGLSSGPGPPSSPSQHSISTSPTLIPVFSIVERKTMSPVVILTSPPVFPLALFFPVFKSHFELFTIFALLLISIIVSLLLLNSIELVDPDPLSLIEIETSCTFPPGAATL